VRLVVGVEGSGREWKRREEKRRANTNPQYYTLYHYFYSALNKLLGKEVYTSQDQLGGPQVMGPNGVTHQVVQDDQEGVAKILQVSDSREELRASFEERALRSEL